jgi:hypothetical protein
MRTEPVGPAMDQRTSGSAVDGAPTEGPRPDANNARSQRPAPEGNWRVPCSCLLCWNARGCPQAFQHVPRSSILCGCINGVGPVPEGLTLRLRDSWGTEVRGWSSLALGGVGLIFLSN